MCRRLALLVISWIALLSFIARPVDGRESSSPSSHSRASVSSSRKKSRKLGLSSASSQDGSRPKRRKKFKKKKKRKQVVEEEDGVIHDDEILSKRSNRKSKASALLEKPSSMPSTNDGIDLSVLTSKRESNRRKKKVKKGRKTRKVNDDADGDPQILEAAKSSTQHNRKRKKKRATMIRKADTAVEDLKHDEDEQRSPKEDRVDEEELPKRLLKKRRKRRKRRAFTGSPSIGYGIDDISAVDSIITPQETRSGAVGAALHTNGDQKQTETNADERVQDASEREFESVDDGFLDRLKIEVSSEGDDVSKQLQMDESNDNEQLPSSTRIDERVSSDCAEEANKRSAIKGVKKQGNETTVGLSNTNETDDLSPIKVHIPLDTAQADDGVTEDQPKNTETGDLNSTKVDDASDISQDESSCADQAKHIDVAKHQPVSERRSQDGKLDEGSSSSEAFGAEEGSDDSESGVSGDMASDDGSIEKVKGIVRDGSEQSVDVDAGDNASTELLGTDVLTKSSDQVASVPAAENSPEAPEERSTVSDRPADTLKSGVVYDVREHVGADLSIDAQPDTKMPVFPSSELRTDHERHKIESDDSSHDDNDHNSTTYESSVQGKENVNNTTNDSDSGDEATHDDTHEEKTLYEVNESPVSSEDTDSNLQMSEVSPGADVVPEKHMNEEIDKDALAHLTPLPLLMPANQTQTDLIVSAVTWNLAEASPSEEESTFIQVLCKGDKKQSLRSSDFVLVAGQECENIKPRRSEGHRSREFRRLIIQMLGRQYVPIALHMLGGIQFALFCRRRIIGEVQSAALADVTCGIGNVFHNKGAIGCFVKMKPRAGHELPSRMLFIGAHMAAHVKNSEARDADFWRIMSELQSQAPHWFLKPSAADEESDGMRLQEVADFILFCGDLNYRIDLPREEVESTIELARDDAVRQRLLNYDQLKASIASENAFLGFCEGEIKFMPTFKFDKGTNDYDTSKKQRIPAWTDRILYKSKQTVEVVKYDCANESTHSDHRPVYGTFRIVAATASTKGNENEVATTKRTKRRKRKRNNTSVTGD